MIASLRGILIEKHPGACVIEAGGVGYLVNVSTHTARELPAEGAAVFLRTHQVVREDAVQLFGFAEPSELQLFELLIGVSGVGPRLALAVLSGLKPGALARALRDENLAALVAVPGIGRKTAERLVVELRDRVAMLEIDGAAAEPRGAAPALSEEFRDAVAALTRLGYTAAQSQEAVRRAAGAESNATLETLVRRALATLSKPAVVAR
jgi:Holliday junction DNA helicase RuvA